MVDICSSLGMLPGWRQEYQLSNLQSLTTGMIATSCVAGKVVPVRSGPKFPFIVGPISAASMHLADLEGCRYLGCWLHHGPGTLSIVSKGAFLFFCCGEELGAASPFRSWLKVNSLMANHFSPESPRHVYDVHVFLSKGLSDYKTRAGSPRDILWDILWM